MSWDRGFQIHECAKEQNAKLRGVADRARLSHASERRKYDDGMNKKLIEAALPLEAINRASARENSRLCSADVGSETN